LLHDRQRRRQSARRRKKLHGRRLSESERKQSRRRLPNAVREKKQSAVRWSGERRKTPSVEPERSARWRDLHPIVCTPCFVRFLVGCVGSHLDYSNETSHFLLQLFENRLQSYARGRKKSGAPWRRLLVAPGRRRKRRSVDKDL
jgi:hypothetical protein